MFAKYSHLLFVLSSCIMACCTNQSSFSDKEKPIVGEKINMDCLIGHPSEIVCADSLLMFYDRYDKQLITVFDVKNNKLIRRFINEGKGPDEMIPSLELSVTDGLLYVFQMQTGGLSIYNVKDVANTEQAPIAVNKLMFSDRPANIKPTQSGFVGIGMFDDGRYHLYNQNAEYIDAAGTYPFKGEEMDPTMRFFIYQGNLCSNGENFALGSPYCDNIEFYQVDDEKVSLARKYGTTDVKGQFNQRVLIEDDCVMNYKAAYGGKKYCYTLYSGKTYLEHNKRSFSGSKFRVFDWSGNYIQSFATDMDIFSICVDEPNGIIYGVVHDDNEGFIIARFNIH